MNGSTDTDCGREETTRVSPRPHPLLSSQKLRRETPGPFTHQRFRARGR